MMRGAPSDNPDIDAKIQDLIESHPVSKCYLYLALFSFMLCVMLKHYGDRFSTVIFSKSYCPFCMDAKSLLKRHNAEFYTVELDQIGRSSISSNRRVYFFFLFGELPVFIDSVDSVISGFSFLRLSQRISNARGTSTPDGPAYSAEYLYW